MGTEITMATHQIAAGTPLNKGPCIGAVCKDCSVHTAGHTFEPRFNPETGGFEDGCIYCSWSGEDAGKHTIASHATCGCSEFNNSADGNPKNNNPNGACKCGHILAMHYYLVGLRRPCAATGVRRPTSCSGLIYSLVKS